MTSLPLVSILMPVYNSENYVAEAIQSILAQTFRDFELIIYDDASTDQSVRVIEGFSDERILLFKKEQNSGYTNSLIAGLKIARGRYIARMDSDDICSPDRIERQVAFLESRPDYGIIGTFIKTISSRQDETWKFPVGMEAVQCYLVCNSPFAHPSVMIRKSILDKFGLSYDAAYEPCEDFKLWFEILKHTRGDNIPEALLRYRLHSNQTIVQKKEALISRSNQVRREVFQFEFGRELSEEELKLNFDYFNSLNPNKLSDVLRYKKWRNIMRSITSVSVNAREYHRLVDKAWIGHLMRLTEFKPYCLQYLFSSCFLRDVPYKGIVTFLVKSLISYRVRVA